jgi:predicted aldo/keto reductase-like oxidoreductase
MIYNEFKGLKISDLGFDTKRLPLIGQDESMIDEEQSEEMIRYALEHGINYFDTAWNYHGGHAASLLGRVLSDYPREQYFIANKFPGYDLKNMPKYEYIFEKQLEDCRADHFDFYLLHNVDELNIESYLSKDNRVMDYLIEQKEKGRIRHLGIHTNGKTTTIERFLNVYGDQIEFAQIQLNYLDWTLLNAKDRVEYLRKRGLPIWAMGPLRNGQLTRIEKSYEDTLRMFRPDETPAGWAYRFVQSTAAVKTILSGISSLEQLKSDIKIFENDITLLNGKEAAILLTLVSDALSRKLINCTACRNCTEFCKHRLDIPTLIDLYNEYKLTNSTEFITRPWSSIPKDKLPSMCVGCGACEKVCPRHIKVSGIMKELSEIMESASGN